METWRYQQYIKTYLRWTNVRKNMFVDANPHVTRGKQGIYVSAQKRRIYNTNKITRRISGTGDRAGREAQVFQRWRFIAREDEAQGGSSRRQCETSPWHPTNRTDGISLPRARNTRVTRVDVYNPPLPGSDVFSRSFLFLTTLSATHIRRAKMIHDSKN